MGGKSDMRFFKNWSLTPLNLTWEALWVTGERALVLCPLASAAVPCPGHVRLPEVWQLQPWVWGLAYTVPQGAQKPCFWVPVRTCVLTWGVGSGSAPSSPSKAKLSFLSLPFSGGLIAQWEFCGLGRQAQNPDPPKILFKELDIYKGNIWVSLPHNGQCPYELERSPSLLPPPTLH